jgi:lipid II:glycine glycyltransferase (peptidoglycan interpeptide bridge formation enzyme)
LNVREATPEEMADWDALTVEASGGNVYQSKVWAAHRSSSGWMARFLVTDDGGRVLALTRAWPWSGGGSAYLPRGPVPAGADPSRSALAERQIAVAGALAAEGIDVVAADPEVPAAEVAFRTRIVGAGFHPIDEIQSSRHRVTLPLGPGTDEAAVFEGVAKSTRQRIRGAVRDGVAVVRHDRRAEPDGVGEGFVTPDEPAGDALDRFYDLLLETGERLHFAFGPRGSFVAWWRAAHEAGHLVYLEARAVEPGAAPDQASEPLAGLLLYRHGGRLSTVHSGDHAASRADHPGALHLLRWRAIQLAIREVCVEMDLGGVDVAGSRGEPREGDPLYGLYQHKRAFGGEWLELTGAHERVFDARGYALGRLTGRVSRLLRR